MDKAGIGKKIEGDLALAVKTNKEVARLYSKAIDGVMTYDEAGRFASMLGEEIGGIIFNNLSDAFPTGVVVAEDIMELIPSALRGEYSYVTRAIEAAQTTINKKAKVGLKAIVPDFDIERATGIAEEVAKAEALSAVQKTLPQMTENLSRHAVDRAIMENMKAHNNLGLETTVIREYDDVGLHDGKDDCKFCLERAGTWTYKEAKANDVFRRHPGCECKITYISKRSTQVQTNWRQNMWEEVGQRR